MLKVMKLWNGRIFYFHFSQETKLLLKELSVRAVLLKSLDTGRITEYRNADIPVFWAETMPCEILGTELEANCHNKKTWWTLHRLNL